ncbi:MAG: sigma-70 family RNA polymerase sigma factor [Oscillospiraceae bacterium]|nr:sigma-70 family RNA polymerase sigma factor [Oscillospiraceae bacterium]
MFNLFLQLALENMLFLGLHLDGRNMFPKQLSKKEEEEVIKLIANGDTAARDKLIEHNLRLVAYIVNKNYPESYEQDDLISIGTIGLIRAAETFDYSKGHHFSTYASKCIDNQIKMYFRKIKHQLTEVSISDPIDSDAEGNALTLADICSSDINVEEDVMLKINSEKLYRFIEEELDDREREIIAKRYGIPDKDGRVCKPLTQREIAKELKISRSYISRIEKRALEKLKGRFEA